MTRRTAFLLTFAWLVCGTGIMPAPNALGQESLSQRRLPTAVFSQSPLQQLQQLLRRQEFRDVQDLHNLRRQMGLNSDQLLSLVKTYRQGSGPGGRVSSVSFPVDPNNPPTGESTGPSPAMIQEAVRLMKRLGRGGPYDSLERLLSPQDFGRLTDQNNPRMKRELRERGIPESFIGRFPPNLLQHFLSRFNPTPAPRELPGGLKEMLSDSLSARDGSSARVAERLLKRFRSAEQDSSFDVSEELSKNGLGSTLQRLLQDAHRQVSHSSGSEKPGVLDSIVMEVLEGMRGDISEIIKHLDEVTRDDVTETDGGNRASTALSSSATSRESSTSRASTSFSGPVGSTSASTAGSESRALAGASAPSAGVLDFQVLQLGAILVALVACAGCWQALGHRRRVHEEVRRQAAAAVAVKPNDIQSREDIVRAFHWLTRRNTNATEAWWTHRRAARVLASETPAIREPLDTLAEIYEWARYDSREDAAASDRIQAARVALAGCLS